MALVSGGRNRYSCAVRVPWHLEVDVHLVCIYRVGDRSEHRDPQSWAHLAAKLHSLPPDHHVMLLGDMNARIGTTSPAICTCVAEADSAGCECVVERDSDDVLPPNPAGRCFLDLCSSSNLCILNGLKRVNDQHFSFPGSESVTFTSLGGNGCSVIDYVCVDAALLHHISSFAVCSNASILSDHRPLVCYLRPSAPHMHSPTIQPTAPSRKLRWSPVVRQQLCDVLPRDSLFSSATAFLEQALTLNAPVDHGSLQAQFSLAMDRLYVCATGRPPADKRPKNRGRRSGPPKKRHAVDDPHFVAQTQWHDRQCDDLKRAHTALLHKAVRARNRGRGEHKTAHAAAALRK